MIVFKKSTGTRPRGSLIRSKQMGSFGFRWYQSTQVPANTASAASLHSTPGISSNRIWDHPATLWRHRRSLVILFGHHFIAHLRCPRLLLGQICFVNQCTKTLPPTSLLSMFRVSSLMPLHVLHTVMGSISSIVYQSHFCNYIKWSYRRP